jgi:SAM-dependent methyltransferase
MKEHYYDKLLNIKTTGEQQGFPKSLNYHRYEPTPYSALEQLFAKYEVNRRDQVVDFGCGKGRLNFYIHYFYHASVVGVEMDERLYQAAIANLRSYVKKTKNRPDRIQFCCCLAEDYVIDPQDNRFYFFNPFAIQIFRTIIHNILLSVEAFAREIELVLYYPSEDYIFFLENDTAFELQQEITLPHQYPNNPNERFLIYRLGF